MMTATYITIAMDVRICSTSIDCACSSRPSLYLTLRGLFILFSGLWQLFGPASLLPTLTTSWWCHFHKIFQNWLHHQQFSMLSQVFFFCHHCHSHEGKTSETALTLLCWLFYPALCKFQMQIADILLRSQFIKCKTNKLLIFNSHFQNFSGCICFW